MLYDIYSIKDTQKPILIFNAPTLPFVFLSCQTPVKPVCRRTLDDHPRLLQPTFDWVSIWDNC